MYKFIEKFEETVNYSASQIATITKLVSSGLKPAAIWSGSIKSSGVKIKERNGIKSHLKSELERIQEGICAYCGFSFDYRVGTGAKRNIHREHIAPKEQHPEFIFESTNIVLSCSICNGFDFKGVNDTIEQKNANYQICRFRLIHPYFDNRSDHFELKEETGVLELKNNSGKGRYTIKLFKLNDKFHVVNRYILLKTSKNPPIPADVLNEISSNIIAS